MSTMTPGPGSPGTRPQRWLGRLSFVLAGLAAVFLVVFAGLKSLAVLAVGLAAGVAGLAAAYVFWSRRDIAGLGRRARLDRGSLGVAGVTVGSTAQAIGLLRGRHATGLSVLAAAKIEITAGAAQVPVGIDGESVLLQTPVTCTISPGALRVRVPRDRPGVPAPKPPKDWARLRHLASITHPAPGSLDQQEE